MAGNSAPFVFPSALIDLDRLAANFRLVGRLVGPRTRVAAMVKADAYGHGLVRVAKALRGLGCEIFGVATVAEATRLRDAGLGGCRLIVFGAILPDEARAAVACNAEVVIDNLAVADALAASARAANTQAEVHVAVDTGMRRLGLFAGDALAFIEHVEAAPGLVLRGVCSHFAHAEAADQQLLRAQLADFAALRSGVLGLGLEPEFHIANSAAVLAAPRAHLDMVRPGLMLYGLSPRPGIAYEAELAGVMSLVARIVRVAALDAGEGIGYGHTFRTSRASVIATVRMGYGDGYPRALSNRGEVLVNGVAVRVVGNVCMDHFMIDVTDLEGIEVGDEVVLWGEGLKAEEVAAKADTISYELVTRVGDRVERRYCGDPH